MASRQAGRTEWSSSRCRTSCARRAAALRARLASLEGGAAAGQELRRLSDEELKLHKEAKRAEVLPKVTAVGADEFKRLYHRHKDLDKQVMDAELGVRPMDDMTLHSLKKEKLRAKDRLFFLWEHRT